MTTITDSLTATQTATSASARAGSVEAMQERFLSLLVAQMKNQDPLNPLDNAQVTSQMAQLSTVQGIEKMYGALESLAASMGAGQAAQAAGLIERVVLAPGDAVGPGEDANVIAWELPYGVDTLTATVRDASGNPVRTLALGEQDGGVGMIAWDGLDDTGQQVPDGVYRFSFEAGQGGRAVDVTPLALGQVQGVQVEAGRALLDMGHAGTVAFDSVRRIY